MSLAFYHWTKARKIRSLGTNAGAEPLPFQEWRRFKEAFTPELVQRAVRESRVRVERCIDPFGGSGTTALACQFLRIHGITIEVNPFLADLISAKLTPYNTDSLATDLSKVMSGARRLRCGPSIFKSAPPTFLEPGVNGRWIFDFDVATRIARLLTAIQSLPNARNRRLFRVLLGGILVEVSNVITSGKGRRYRQNWDERRCEPDEVTERFRAAATFAIEEIRRYSNQRRFDHTMIRGDARASLQKVDACDLAVLSPPYPNSFDYTDVYNIELWSLGYLSSATGNQRLRSSTLSSHVQILREFEQPPTASLRLTRVLNNLKRNRDELWNRYIPEMVGGYFADMHRVLRELHRVLPHSGSAWIVVGDSQYLDCRIRTSHILADLAENDGWHVDSIERFRSMRASAQQGGVRALDENLIVLTKA